MSDLSKYFAKKLGDYVFRGVAFAPPATYYLALFTAETGLDDNNPTAEVTNVGYAREAITLAAWTLATKAGATSADILVDPAGENWSAVTHVALVDHISATNWGTGVNVCAWKIAPTPRTAETGDQLRIVAGALTITL